MNFTSIKLVSTVVLLALLAACGGGGGGQDSSQSNTNPPPIAANTLVSLERHTGPKGTFQNFDITMPSAGIVDFSLIGVRARIFDATRLLIAESSYTPDTTYLVNLPAGKYVVEYEYWSSNSRDAVAYSPALLSFASLPQLKSAVYSSNEDTTAFYRASFANDSIVNFSGQGVYVAVLKSDMTMAHNVGSSYSPITVTAGDYVFHLKFLSSNSKSISISSTALPI